VLQNAEEVIVVEGNLIVVNPGLLMLQFDISQSKPCVVVVL